MFLRLLNDDEFHMKDWKFHKKDSGDWSAVILFVTELKDQHWYKDVA